MLPARTPSAPRKARRTSSPSYYEAVGRGLLLVEAIGFGGTAAGSTSPVSLQGQAPLTRGASRPCRLTCLALKKGR